MKLKYRLKCITVLSQSLPEGTVESHVKDRMGHSKFEPGTTKGGYKPSPFYPAFLPTCCRRLHRLYF